MLIFVFQNSFNALTVSTDGGNTPEKTPPNSPRALVGSLSKYFINSSPIKALKKTVFCVSPRAVKEDKPFSLRNLPKHILQCDLGVGLIDDGFINQFRLKNLVPTYREEVIAARNLMKEGNFEEGRKAFIQATKTRTYDNKNEYTQLVIDQAFFGNAENIIAAIEKLAGLFEKDVKAENKS
ncbi:uncharacterized protein LOC126839705 [Adelges cooleyi]|uniref:uncharacterized protein LOC126839705 n=1 Tax=Adelges cooleyi TaxID=133065 RepID=UPI00217F9FB4|nr:uncharacterized protein LOC126839705 [Adelges cooleyi]